MSTVLILGAHSDMAKACAYRYASAGYDLYLAARDADVLTAFANDLIIRTSVSIRCISFDATDFNSHHEFYRQLEIKPEGVISFIGFLGSQAKAQDDWSESIKIIQTNYTGLVSILNIVANDMEDKKSGWIVGVSSVAGDRGRLSNYMYGSAKAGFTAYLSGLRNRLFHSKVHVLTVKPGFVATKMTAEMNLPAKLTAKPEAVAKDIFKAQQKNKNVLYTKWLWRWIMLVIKSIPEWMFKKMKL